MCQANVRAASGHTLSLGHEHSAISIVLVMPRSDRTQCRGIGGTGAPGIVGDEEFTPEQMRAKSARVAGAMRRIGLLRPLRRGAAPAFRRGEISSARNHTSALKRPIAEKQLQFSAECQQSVSGWSAIEHLGRR
jgi:hypothetical protein